EREPHARVTPIARRRAQPALLRAVRRLDLDDARAEVGEQESAIRTGDVFGKIEDGYSLQQLCTHLEAPWRLGCSPRAVRLPHGRGMLASARWRKQTAARWARLSASSLAQESKGFSARWRARA